MLCGITLLTQSQKVRPLQSFALRGFFAPTSIVVQTYRGSTSLCHYSGIMASLLDGSHHHFASQRRKACPLLASLVRALTTVGRAKIKIAPFWVLFLFWSGLRGSNPPPSPWQGDALPNELNPHIGKWSNHNVNPQKPLFLDDFCALHSKQGITLQVGKCKKR